MPRKTPADALASFIRLQDADTLASVLIELATNHPAVNDRLVRLQLSNQPKALAQGFRKALTAWKRSTKYLGYSQAGEFGRDLETWLGQIERELMPQDQPLLWRWPRRSSKPTTCSSTLPTTPMALSATPCVPGVCFG